MKKGGQEMKKYLSFILLLVLLFSGCTENTEAPENMGKADNVGTVIGVVTNADFNSDEPYIEIQWTNNYGEAIKIETTGRIYKHHDNSWVDVGKIEKAKMTEPLTINSYGKLDPIQYDIIDIKNKDAGRYAVRIDFINDNKKMQAEAELFITERKVYVTPKPTPKPKATPPTTTHGLMAKPVIYLYPQEDTEVFVELDYNGELKYTYPLYKNGWHVLAKKDGTIINLDDNKEYSYLFWEGDDELQCDFSKGFCVKGEDTAEFLQKVLPEMGLKPKEYNEFIVYWLPKMQDNPYNIISFQYENYWEMAKLKIKPKPDSLLRVSMAYKASDVFVEIEPQQFDSFSRKGFTVVEWGGKNVE